MITINITLKIPEGKYPQPALYRHFGRAPIKNRIKRTIKIVPSIKFPLCYKSYIIFILLIIY